MARFEQSSIDPAGGPDGAVVGLPVAGIVTTMFGRIDTLHPTGHGGLDIAAPEGTPILAPAAGTVADVFVLPNTGNGWDNFKDIFGNCVIIDHGDCFTLYGHMRDAPLVHEGQAVSAGDQLGVVGSTGFSTGAHLHFAVAKPDNRYFQFGTDGTPVGTLIDPVSMFGAGPAVATGNNDAVTVTDATSTAQGVMLDPVVNADEINLIHDLVTALAGGGAQATVVKVRDSSPPEYRITVGGWQ